MAKTSLDYSTGSHKESPGKLSQVAHGSEMSTCDSRMHNYTVHLEIVLHAKSLGVFLHTKVTAPPTRAKYLSVLYLTQASVFFHLASGHIPPLNALLTQSRTGHGSTNGDTQ